MRIDTSFAKWLRSRRHVLDLTQEELADRVGCSVVTIRKIETDERRPSKQIAERLADALDVPLSDRSGFVQFARADSSVSSMPGPVSESTPPWHAAAPDVLCTKFHVPEPPPSHVPCPRLLLALDAGLGHPLTAVTAPTGFGKTTLLALWHASLRAREIPAAWISLHEGDNDPARFWTHVTAALDRLRPGVYAAATAFFQSSQPPAEAFLTDLINHLAALPRDVVLVLDDYHLIGAETIHQGLKFLLDHMPGRLHLVLASRVALPLPLARLRVRQQAIELGTMDLRFTLEETAAFFRDVMGVQLTPEDVAAIDARTEGWIAGLQLAGVALRGRAREEHRQVLQVFAGSNHYTMDYLVAEVLDELPPHLRTFVLQTAILDRMCGPLCDALHGVDDGAIEEQDAYSRMMLDELERRNLFLIPLDEERRWYRYHHLFAKVVRSQLTRGASRAEIASLHRRASAWFEAQGLLVEAVGHAFAAHALEAVVRIVEHHGAMLMAQGNVQQVSDWLDRLPKPAIRIRPILSIVRAMAYLLSNRLGEVDVWVRDAVRAIEVDTPEAHARIIRGSALVMQAKVSYLSGDLQNAVPLFRKAVEMLPEADDQTLPGLLVSVSRATAQTALTAAYKATGDVSATSERPATAAGAPIRASGNVGAMLNSVARGTTARVAGAAPRG